MTIRIFTLGLFALLCFFAGGMVAPRLSFAAEDGAQAAPEQSVQQEQGVQQEQAGPGRHRQLRDELMKLPPEERRARIKALKQQMSEGRAQKLEARKAEFQNKWESATPGQRAEFCTRVQQKCASGEKGAQFACKVAKTKCEGQ